MKKQLLILISLFYFSFTFLNAQIGSLDATFDGDGMFSTPISLSDDDRPTGILVQPDGKILIAGYSGDFGASLEMVIIRLNADGSPDATFNGTGGWTFSFGTGYGRANSILLQNDGKIIVGGYSRTAAFEEFTLIRLHPTGMFDSSFSADGIQTINFIGEFAQGYSAALQSDGKIVLGGQVGISNRSFAITRSHSDGTPDSTFGGTGQVITHFPNGLSDIDKIAIQNDGKIIAAGSFIDTTTFNYDFALARYKTNGDLDSSFGVNGKSLVDFSSGMDDYCFGMELLPDGSILTTGQISSFGNDFMMAKYKTNGTLDSSFGNNGLVAVGTAGATISSGSICIQPDNKILLAGMWNNGGGNDFALMRFNFDGTIDSSFNGTGLTVTNFGSTNDYVTCLSIQPDLKIIAAGVTNNGSDRDFAAARYVSGLNLGTIDFSNSANNILVYPNPILQETKLKYSLKKEEKISIDLFDASGKLIMNLVKGETKNAGDHQQLIQFPPDLTSGTYYLTVSNNTGTVSVKLIK